MRIRSGALRLGLGTMRLEGEDAFAVLHRALDAGVRLFDTADVYGPDPADPGANERLLGKALRTWSGDRSEVVVATKGGLVRRGEEWIPDGRAKHLEERKGKQPSDHARSFWIFLDGTEIGQIIKPQAALLD